jgi:hypothetical protein
MIKKRRDIVAKMTVVTSVARKATLLEIVKLRR